MLGGPEFITARGSLCVEKNGSESKDFSQSSIIYFRFFNLTALKYSLSWLTFCARRFETF